MAAEKEEAELEDSSVEIAIENSELLELAILLSLVSIDCSLSGGISMVSARGSSQLPSCLIDGLEGSSQATSAVLPLTLAASLSFFFFLFKFFGS